MPKSKVRKKTAYTPPADRRTPVKLKAAGPTGLLWKILMFGLMLIGLIWLIVNYIAQDKISWMGAMGNWNFAIGFGMMIAGLLMTMRWR